MLEYQFQPIYTKQTTQQNRTRKTEISAAEKKKKRPYQIRRRIRINPDTYEVLKLELDNTTNERNFNKSLNMRTTKIIHF
jgi:hypothetical protein